VAEPDPSKRPGRQGRSGIGRPRIRGRLRIVTASVRQLLRDVAHRPYALPAGPWIGRQRWSDLLLAHWPVDADALVKRIPEPLVLDTFRGSAWITVVPFRMEQVRPRGIPEAFGLTFPELNVRTYVRHGERSGVWFLSLDASSMATVAIGRRLYGLPYFRAGMSMEQNGASFRFQSEREDGTAAFSATWRGGETVDTSPGSLNEWLMERYCFYSRRSDGRVLRGDVHHRKWPVLDAVAQITRSRLDETHPGLRLGEPPALLHSSPGVDVIFWRAQPVG
jgi:uncharacterized protein